MGIRNDAKLVVGWEISFKGLRQWCNEHGNCDMAVEDDWELLENMIENASEALPPGWFLEYASPYFDGGAEAQHLFVTATNNNSSTLDDLLAAVGCKEAAKKAAEIAQAMGAEDTHRIHVSALPHIW